MTDLISRKELREQQGQEDLPWGDAHPHRGENFHDLAASFIAAFPVGSEIKSEHFDEWVRRKGLLEVPVDAPKQSDAWKAYLMRRHELRYNINKAGTHPRMGENAFTIDAVRQGYWTVRSPQMAIAKNELVRKTQSVFVTKRKKLNYLMQSADWSILPVHERIIAEELYHEIDNVEQRFNFDADQLTAKFGRLEHKIRVAVDMGLIKPIDYGIKELIDVDDQGDEVLKKPE